MFHNCKAVVALSKEQNDTRYQKTLGLNDFYFGAEDYEFPVGNIQMVGKSNAAAMKGEEPKLTKLAPHWSLADVAEHAVDFWLTTEDLPMPDNRVTVGDDGNVHLAYEATNNEEADRLYHELKKILNHVGMADHHVLDKNFYMDMSIPVAGCAHQAGTCRFGTDPTTSVLDENCKAHELDNLYVVDTSFFPSIGAVNPRSHGHGERHPGGRAPPRAKQLAAPRRTLEDRSMASSAERRVIKVAAAVQGIVLVTFPAASTIFTDPQRYGLSNSAVRGAVPAAGAHGDHVGPARCQPVPPGWDTRGCTWSVSWPTSCRWCCCW